MLIPAGLPLEPRDRFGGTEKVSRGLVFRVCVLISFFLY